MADDDVDAGTPLVLPWRGDHRVEIEKLRDEVHRIEGENGHLRASLQRANERVSLQERRAELAEESARRAWELAWRPRRPTDGGGEAL
jgi:hypothetical protein